ncbi:oligosaccharide flippase family protein [Haladaptatus caseinilyticus]|uniref:oligosaccharide flippase family protein n=1 Tax=Haladaptatus caseinilyticus TaxID=2993314 RepID=UPI00224AB615|nr:oligosaccharide flippase family protein [Haladaptatus caseinilyticus]
MADQSSDSSLKSVSRGASFFMAGKGLDNGLRFVLNWVLVRGLGGLLFSVYTLGLVVLTFAQVFTNLGTNQAIMKFIPKYDGNPLKRRRMLGLSYLTSLVAGVAVGVIIFVAAPWISQYADPEYQKQFVDVLRVFAFLLPLDTLISCFGSLFKSLEMPEYQVFIRNILTPLFRVIGVSIALLLGLALLETVVATVVAAVIVFCIAIWLVVTKADLKPKFGASRDELIEFYDFSLPLTASHTGQVLASKVDLLMVGFLAGAYISTPDAVGIYKIAVVLAGILLLPLSAFSQLFPPIASRLYNNGEMKDLETLYRRITRWTFTLGLFPAIGAVIYAHELLVLFSESFAQQGVMVLLLLVVAQLANASVGPSGYVLMMTDHHYLALVNQWVLGVCNVIMNYLFIKEFGLIGAALASATVIVAINVLRIYEVWYTEGLFPYSRRYIKPVFAGAVSAVVMFGTKTILTGYVSGIGSDAIVALVQGAIGGVVGLAAFAGMLYLLGIEQEDRDFFAENLPT